MNINYILKRSKIKNIYIQIKEGEVIVKAPYRTSIKYIEQLLSQKQEWIEKNLEKEKNRPSYLNPDGNSDLKPLSKQEILNLRQIVIKSAQKYTDAIKQYPNKITIKDLKYAWGSCTSNRNIAINKKLARMDVKLIEYVVLHEVCHLKHMNHSKEFWALVESQMPDYKKYRKELKKCHT